MSIIGEILAEAERTGAINFGPGLPDPKTFPVEEMKEFLREMKASDLNYTPYPGRKDLVEEAKQFLEKMGIEDREIIVTAGGQEAIALVALFLRRKGMSVTVSNPTYLEALTTFRNIGVEVRTAGIDDNGEVPVPSEAYYVIPTGHNPTGRTMDSDRRNQFAELDALIIEDGTYDLLYYNDRKPPIASLRNDSIYIFSTSKILSPGLRIAFLAVPREIYDELLRLRPALNIIAPAISQFVVLRALESGLLEKNVQKARKLYKEKRDRMVRGLRGVLEFVPPDAGFFVWAKTPVPAMELLQKTREKGVVFIPGEGFFVKNPDRCTARLSFSKESPERIEQGTEILREVIESL